MRVITKKVVGAFNAGRAAKSGNTESTGNALYLHRNLIARRISGVVEITHAGWATNTTKERLNGITGVSISQRDFSWFLNGEKWDGGWASVGAA